MVSKLLLPFCLILCLGSLVAEDFKRSCHLEHKGQNKKFPDDFKFGAATAAYQIEGGWDADGSGLSLWDTFTHDHPEKIEDRSSGDVGADSYHLFDQDLDALKQLNASCYRLSVSWSRVLPNGDVSSFNQKGIDYYNMVIDKLLENNIEPIVTMNHFDIPEEISKLGGFTNPLFIEYFFYYADTLFHHFGDRVKRWITFNEPLNFCINGYSVGNFPPNVKSPGVGEYICMDTVLKSHGLVYRHYREKYYEQQKGKIGITLNSRFFFAKDNNDSAAVERAMEYMLGLQAHPIFSKTGNYPSLLLEDILQKSIEEGRAWSRLRPLKASWADIIKGSADFLGLNYYTSRFVERGSGTPNGNSFLTADANLTETVDTKWLRGKSSWLFCVPEGLEGILNWIRENYDNVEVIITENGISDGGTLEDTDRVQYLKSHLQAILNAINNGCNVTGYTFWSLIDNFEWLSGYTEKFGLFSVDMTSDQRGRTPKQSARFYQQVIESKMIPELI